MVFAELGSFILGFTIGFIAAVSDNSKIAISTLVALVGGSLLSWVELGNIETTGKLTAFLAGGAAIGFGIGQYLHKKGIIALTFGKRRTR